MKKVIEVTKRWVEELSTPPTYSYSPSAPSDREDRGTAEQYRQFYGRGEFRYAVYPDFWKNSWGKVPLLGIVSADNEFLAERLALDRGFLKPVGSNFRFKNLGVNRAEERRFNK